MKECTECFHHQQHADGSKNENDEANDKDNNIVLPPSKEENLLIEDSGQLRVCKAKGPQTKIRSCIRDCSEHKLYGMYQLMHKNFTELKFLMITRIMTSINQ
nr:hypothetical protein Iba_chr06aCG0680 [Ipomoea batatas]